jgi:SPP1 family predicted phage head-tail adaptor
MLRAGKLDRLITLERKSETVSHSGAVVSVWAEIATVRAELVQQSADEYLSGYGEAEQGNLVFRIRWMDGITTADRVTYEGAALDIDQITELGRKRGLELCVSGGAV